MKVALPIWDDRISPVFDVARKLRVVEVEDGGEIDRIDHRVSPGSHVSLLSELGVEVLICSAISRALEASARSAGIEVIADVFGEVDEVIRAYLRDDLAECRLSPLQHSRRGLQLDRSIGTGRRGTRREHTRRSLPTGHHKH
jgi:predicted Fe-Mo cluster-binding NifX family protein